MTALPPWLRTPFTKLVASIVVLLLLSTLGFWWFELRYLPGKPDFFSALWWTVVTMTTVGYGDIVPNSVGGRLMGVVVMLCGIGLVSTFTGSLASLLVERKAKKRKGLLEVKLNDHVILIGWNGFAQSLLETLRDTGQLAGRALVLVNTLPEELRNEISYTLGLGDRLSFVWGQPGQKSVIAKARPESARVVYIMSDTRSEKSPKEADQDAIYAALIVRGMSPKAPIYGEVALPENREHLLRAGVSEIMVRGEVGTRILGLMGQSASMWSFMQSLLGLRGQSLLGFRKLGPAERRLDWGGLVRACRQEDQSQPLALCQTGRDLKLEDILDQGSALDDFILELFQTAGQETTIGSSGPRVFINPPDDQDLSGYDSLLFLKAGRDKQ